MKYAINDTSKNKKYFMDLVTISLIFVLDEIDSEKIRIKHKDTAIEKYDWYVPIEQANISDANQKPFLWFLSIHTDRTDNKIPKEYAAAVNKYKNVYALIGMAIINIPINAAIYLFLMSSIEATKEDDKDKNKIEKNPITAGNCVYVLKTDA